MRNLKVKCLLLPIFFIGCSDNITPIKTPTTQEPVIIKPENQKNSDIKEPEEYIISETPEPENPVKPPETKLTDTIDETVIIDEEKIKENVKNEPDRQITPVVKDPVFAYLGTWKINLPDFGDIRFFIEKSGTGKFITTTKIDNGTYLGNGIYDENSDSLKNLEFETSIDNNKKIKMRVSLETENILNLTIIEEKGIPEIDLLLNFPFKMVREY